MNAAQQIVYIWSSSSGKDDSGASTASYIEHSAI